jgi:hypothetical protein
VGTAQEAKDLIMEEQIKRRIPISWLAEASTQYRKFHFRLLFLPSFSPLLLRYVHLITIIHQQQNNTAVSRSRCYQASIAARTSSGMRLYGKGNLIEISLPDRE